MTARLPLVLQTPGLAQAARPFVEARVLDAGHVRLLDTVAPRFREARPDVLVALALVLEAEARGHTALDPARARALLDRVEAPLATALPGGELAPPETDTPRLAGAEDPDDTVADEPAPDEPPPGLGDADWARVATGAALAMACPLVGDPEADGVPFARLPTDPGPLLLTRRFLDEQRRVARGLVTLARGEVPEASRVAPDQVEDWVRKVYADEPDGQGARALRRALDGKRLTIVTGGPGTGKTFAVARLLATLIGTTAAAGRTPLRIGLAAPTGKAAVRMTEAIAEAATDEHPARRLAVDAATRHGLRGLPSFTLQKLLRIRPDDGVPRFGPGAPLPYDVLVVDEASMLDVALMRKLVEAVGPETRLLLLGDRDQLASVDAGTVLADVVAGFFADRRDDLAARVVFFDRNHRFAKAPLVGGFAGLVQTRPRETARSERLREAARLLTSADGTPATATTARWWPAEDGERLGDDVLADLCAPFLDGYVARLCGELAPEDDEHVLALLDALDGYRVLCTHRAGPRGVAGMNRAIGQAVRTALQVAWGGRHGGRPLPARAGAWLGLPVLVTENAYGVDLRNGDIGLTLARGRDLEVVFPRGRGHARYPGGLQRVPLGRLPPWKPAFALTIHKSQGSQYRHVAVVLAGRPSPIETRELVYTGVTRAQERLTWVGSAAGLTAALERGVGRMGALQWFIEDALGG